MGNRQNLLRNAPLSDPETRRRVICIAVKHLLCCIHWHPRAISSTVSRVCCDSATFSICVLSTRLGNFKHIDSRTPDTAGCHVWRACGRSLTAQGYLKGCANFALFTAPINSAWVGLCASSGCSIFVSSIANQLRLSITNLQKVVQAFTCSARPPYTMLLRHLPPCTGPLLDLELILKFYCSLGICPPDQ